MRCDMLTSTDNPKLRWWQAKRHWLRLSLRTFFVLLTVGCVFLAWLGWIINRANQQRHAVQWVRQLNGKVSYDFEVDTDWQSISKREKMEREEIKELFRKRGQTAERPFADAKQHRSFGRFHGCGLSRSRAEVGLLVMAQNLLAFKRHGRTTKTTQKQSA